MPLSKLRNMYLPEHSIEVKVKRESQLLEEMLLSTEFCALMDVARSSVILPSFPQMESAPRREAEDQHAPSRDAVTSVVKEGASGIVKQLLADHAG
jgi:hypothetical protein